MNGNTQGVRELYRAKQNTSPGTRLDYAIGYLADLISAGNGNRSSLNTPQIAIFLTDANANEINAGGFQGLLRSLNAAQDLQNTGTKTVMVLIEGAITAYENDANSKIIIDNIVSNGGRIIKVPIYAEGANPANGYIRDASQAICDLTNPTASDPGLLLVKRITATSPGQPAGSYGFIRFRGRVK